MDLKALDPAPSAFKDQDVDKAAECIVNDLLSSDDEDKISEDPLRAIDAESQEEDLRDQEDLEKKIDDQVRDEIIGREEDFDGYAGNNLMDPEDIERAKQKIRDARKLTAAEILDSKYDKAGEGDEASDDSAQQMNKVSTEMQDLFELGDTKGHPAQALSKKEKRAQKK